MSPYCVRLDKSVALLASLVRPDIIRIIPRREIRVAARLHRPPPPPRWKDSGCDCRAGAAAAGGVPPGECRADSVAVHAFRARRAGHRFPGMASPCKTAVRGWKRRAAAAVSHLR